MLKRVNWLGIFKGFCWLICLSGLVFLMGFVEKKKQEVVCKEVRIVIPGTDNFIERDEINAILSNNFGELRGVNFKDINIHEIEKKISENPYIAFVKVYSEMDGVINIKVKQREPVLRVLNAINQDYYLDSEGHKMPISSNFTAHILVANGNIKEGFSGSLETISTKLLMDLYKTAVFIKKDTLWNAQIEQLYVNDNLDMELVPRVGIQKIILGNADDLDIKMNNLLIFYKKAMPKVGWDTYKTINIKYTNQIIAEKNKIDSTKKQQLILMPEPAIDSNGVNNNIENEVVKNEQQPKSTATTVNIGVININDITTATGNKVKAPIKTEDKKTAGQKPVVQKNKTQQ